MICLALANRDCDWSFNQLISFISKFEILHGDYLHVHGVKAILNVASLLSLDRCYYLTTGMLQPPE